MKGINLLIFIQCSLLSLINLTSYSWLHSLHTTGINSKKDRMLTAGNIII